MFVFTMHWNGILWMYQRINQFDFFFAGMSGNMHILKDYVSALHAELINNIRYCFFISRNRMGTENNGIVWLNGYLTVCSICHTGQCRHGLSLASCRNQNGLLIRIILKHLNIYKCILRHFQITKF